MEDLEALPNILQRKYALLHDLDKSLQGTQRQNEQRCEQEIEDMKKAIKSGSCLSNAPYENSLAVNPGSYLRDLTVIKFSDEALDEQKHAIRIADEKVALAVQAYDLVDAHIQQLDLYLKNLDEDLRHKKEDTPMTASPAPNFDGNAKSGRGGGDGSRGGRKKSRQAAAATTYAANPSGMDLDLPVDPNEPTYCICNQVSYGEMVACDNPDCTIEWFHYGCVGLKDKPKGKWYCPDCIGLQKRRKGK